MSGDTNMTFKGFPNFRSNVTFVPTQFFTIVVPYCQRGTVRITGYALRKVLGWVDRNGNPTREQLKFTYRELIEHAGVSRDCIAEALDEAVEKRFVRCIQSPTPDRSGQPSQSGVYELVWDDTGKYTDNPDAFAGFYYPEAAVVEEVDGSRVVSRPKSSRKNIPNAFFDYLLPRERLAVIRTVGALMFYSIQWGPGGERKLPVSKSITELSRLTRLSRRHTHEAAMEACKQGYIEQTDAGCFDPGAGMNSRSATYAIRWTTECVELYRSKKVHGSLAVGKGQRNRSKKENGERSEMVNGISIKTDTKTLNATTAGGETSETANSVVAESGFDLLRKAGFDERTAGRLASKYSLAVIEKQIQWLDRRTTTRNRLGLLRRAIERNWPEPENTQVNGSWTQEGRQFASHYYAAYHDYSGEAGTEPFAKDITVAAKFIPRLLAQEPAAALIPQWGQRFGRLMREKHKGDQKAKPNLSFALVLYGDQFLRQLQAEGSNQRRKALGQAREAHQRQFMPGYLDYLRQTEIELQRCNAAVYGDFDKHRKRLHKLMTSGPFLTSAKRVSRFEAEDSRLLDFAAFFKDRPKKPVLCFWEWDTNLNPQGFKAKGVNTISTQEVPS